MLNVLEISISELKPWEQNPRINDNAVESVAKSIETFGFNVPILCDQNFCIIAGHTRWKAAKKLSLEKVPVIILEMNDSQRKAFAVADNKLATIADWNNELLYSIFEELKSEEFDISLLGYSNDEIDALLTPSKEFNWDDFDEYFEEKTSTVYGIVPLKIKTAHKEALKTALRNYAKKSQIEEKDPAILSGKVVCRLLGVNSE